MRLGPFQTNGKCVASSLKREQRKLQWKSQQHLSTFDKPIRFKLILISVSRKSRATKTEEIKPMPRCKWVQDSSKLLPPCHKVWEWRRSVFSIWKIEFNNEIQGKRGRKRKEKRRKIITQLTLILEGFPQCVLLFSPQRRVKCKRQRSRSIHPETWWKSDIQAVQSQCSQSSH